MPGIQYPIDNKDAFSDLRAAIYEKTGYTVEIYSHTSCPSVYEDSWTTDPKITLKIELYRNVSNRLVHTISTSLPYIEGYGARVDAVVAFIRKEFSL